MDYLTNHYRNKAHQLQEQYNLLQEKLKFILEDNHKELIRYTAQGKSFELAIPSPEHFLPLLYILALKNNNEQINFFNDKPVAGSLTMTSVKIH